MDETYDVIVIGAGHAGVEAAMAAAGMGCRTMVCTINLDTIGQMSCNPAIGGLAKGQLVREVDALGGIMGHVIDLSGIQYRMLNRSKGPAVRAPRAQADKKLYQFTVKHILEQQEGLMIRQDMVTALELKGRTVTGVRTQSGRIYKARAIVVTTGTFLKGLMHMGEARIGGGRMGDASAEHFSDGLRQLGFDILRLKTGTPPRLNGRTICFEGLETQHGEEPAPPFSFQTEHIDRPSLPCHITYTNDRVHKIVHENLHRSPMYSGQIQSIGPRYCPSIEDKVVRFSDKPAHQIFLEPEGENTLEYYCNGISTSLPQDVQTEIVHSIAGLENADIMRFGYAVEYDIVPARQLYPWLETRTVENLFHAGQINGTSGYEEAAAQGIMAGINAALRVRGDEPFVLGRDEAYVGVLLDDLVTEDPREPYRMFTSRAEYRLLLRQDNADRRLMKYGWRHGLLPEVAWEKLQQKERQITETIDFMEKKYVDQRSLVQHLRRPEYEYDDVEAMSPELQYLELSDDVKEQINIQVKYEGYINRQEQQVIKLRELEDESLPADVDYSAIDSLSNEARGKLDHIRPMTVGQASRISGVTPADISVLMVYFKGGRNLPRKAQPVL